MKTPIAILLCFSLMFGGTRLYIGGGNNPHDILERIVDSPVMWEGYDMAYEYNPWIYIMFVIKW